MKKEKMIIIFFLTGIMALFCADVAFAAETTVNMGSITVHGPCDDPYVVCTPISRDIKVRHTGNTITIQVTYSMSCPGSYDEGYCDISFVGGGGTDSRYTTSTDSGIMTISKFMNPGDTFTVSLHAKYTDWWGSTLLGETTKLAEGIVESVLDPVAEFSSYPSVPTTDNTIWFDDLSTASDTTIVSWSWSFGDGSSSTEQYPTHQYHSSGTYTVTLQVSDDYGGTSQKTHSISVKTKPISQFSYSPLAPTTDDTVYFKDKSYDYDSDGNITSWLWSFGDGASSTEKNPTHQYQKYGRYNVSLKVTDNDSYTDVSYTKITVVQKPTAHFSYSPSWPKLDDSIQFTDLSSAYNGTITSWSWNFGDGTSSTEQYPTHQYQKYGTYTVTLEVTDSNGLKRAKTTDVPVKNDPPTSDFSYSPSSPKSDDSIQFTDLSYDSDGNIVSWSWNFGDGASSSSKNPTHTYTKSDSFTVTLKVTDDDGATDTKKTTLAINSTPGFELILVICTISLILFFKRKSKK